MARYLLKCLESRKGKERCDSPTYIHCALFVFLSWPGIRPPPCKIFLYILPSFLPTQGQDILPQEGLGKGFPGTRASLTLRPLQPLYCTTVLYSTVLYCTLLYSTVLHYTVLHCTVLYCTLLYFTALYYTALYYTVLYCTARCGEELTIILGTIGSV